MYQSIYRICVRVNKTVQKEKEIETIPEVWQVVLSNNPIQSRAVHSYVHGFFDCSGHIVFPLPMILKFSTDVVWLVLFCCLKIGDDAFKCSLYISPNVLDNFRMYSSSQSILSYLNQ